MSPSHVPGRTASRRRRIVARAALALLAPLLCSAGRPTSIRALTEGLELQQKLRVGEVHTYSVELGERELLRVFVQEDGVDVTLRLLGLNDELVTATDSLTVGAETGHAEEDLAALAAVPGQYRLQIVASGLQGPGDYHLRVEGPRQAGEEDRRRAEAVQVTWKGINGLVREDDAAYRREILLLERAVALWTKLQDGRQATQALYALGVKRSGLNEYSRAAEDFQSCADLSANRIERSSKDWQIFCLNSAGAALKWAERRDDAKKRYEKALGLARELGDDAQQATCLTNLGVLEIESGEILHGIALQLEALERARRGGDRVRLATALNNLADAYGQIGDRQKALRFHLESLDLARDLRSRTREAVALNNLGDTYASLGDWERARDHYQRSLTIVRQEKDRVFEARALNNLAVSYEHLGRLSEAQSAYRRALALGREVKDVETQAFALTNQAFLLLRRGQPAQAIELAREALPLAQGASDRAANVYHALGRAHRELGELQAAREALGKALAIARNRGDRGGEAEFRLALARVERDDGDPMAALRHLDPAIEIVESLRGKVVNQELRAYFLAAKQSFYELKIELLMSLEETQPGKGYAVQAFQVSERARARSLLEILNEAEADLRAGVDPALVARESRLRDDVGARELYRSGLQAQEKPDPKKVADAESKIEDALEAQRKVQDEIQESNPRYAALTQPQPLDVAELQRQVLDGEALLLEYSLGAQASFLWAVGADSFAAFRLPARERIENIARRYYELLTVRNNRLLKETVPAWKARIARADAEAKRVSRELSLLILKPVEPLLGGRPLLIVADGALQYIPFAALPLAATGEPLISRHQVASLPSGSVLAVLRRELRGRQRARRTLAIFADPVFQPDDERLLAGPARGPTKPTRTASRPAGQRDQSRDAGLDLAKLRRLPFSKTEADTISALLPAAEVFKAVGFDASRATVANAELDVFRYVHFATHGLIDSRHPGRSGLALSRFNRQGTPQNAVLRLDDIYNLHLAADLVVLSACRTALGKEIRGEGLVGLTRGFMYAGSARVLATLWSVDDRATAQLMASFYRGMLRADLSPAAALRQAQLEMFNSLGRASPYYWAGCSLQGEWR